MRWVRVLLIAGCLGIAAFPAAAQTADPLGLEPVALPPALERVLRDYETAWKAGDGGALAALFTPTGFALNNGRLPLRGREAIAGLVTGPAGDLRLRAFAWEVSDSVGYIVGGYTYPGASGPGGKFLLALKLGPDGRWLIAADMDNAAASPRR